MITGDYCRQVINLYIVDMELLNYKIQSVRFLSLENGCIYYIFKYDGFIYG
jgi:hypothetical protein